MSYGLLENTLEEIQDLQGATIEKVWIKEPDPESEYIDFEYPVVCVRVRYRPGLRVNDLDYGEYEIWQDAEGNGPGFLAFVAPS